MTVTLWISAAVGALVALACRPRETREIAAMLAKIAGALSGLVLLTWRTPPPRARPRTHLDRLTALYMADAIDMDEFERRVWQRLLDGTLDKDGGPPSPPPHPAIQAAATAAVSGADWRAPLNHPMGPPAIKANDVVVMGIGQTVEDVERMTGRVVVGTQVVSEGVYTRVFAHLGDIIGPERTRLVPMTTRRRTYTTISGDEVETFEPVARDPTSRERR